MSNATVDTFAAALSESMAETAARVRASMVQVRAGRSGVGSGVVWNVGQPDASGEAEATVITNAHVARATRETTFTLGLADGREIQATLVAIDPGHDLASLRTKASGLRAATIGASSALRVGEIVIAVGNPYGREGAVTTGIVAARAPADPDMDVEPAEEEERPDRSRYGRGRWHLPGVDLIQADISLYPGNSGGPLADAHGRVVGINAMVGGGLAFAIPSRTVQNFLQEVDRAVTPVYLGVQVITAPLTPALRQRAGVAQESAALVMGVEPASPAETAGIQIGDVLLALDGRPIRDAEQLGRLLNRADLPSSQQRTITLLRGGEKRDLALVPAPLARAAA
ncbi:MAG: S1C family serine protease [Ktedonobacterales bacterium]